MFSKGYPSGQYKTRTAGYGLQTGYKIRTRYKTLTGKYGLGIKHGLGIKLGLFVGLHAVSHFIPQRLQNVIKKKKKQKGMPVTEILNTCT